jgi:transposase
LSIPGVRMLLSAARNVASLDSHEELLRGILRGFGLKVGRTTPRNFEGRARDLDGHATLLVVANVMLRARAVLAEQLGKLQKRLVSLARQDTRARLLMSTPGVRCNHRTDLCSGDRRSCAVLPRLLALTLG